MAYTMYGKLMKIRI
jgi:hypothetical protein